MKHTAGEWNTDGNVIFGGLKTKGCPFGINRIASVNQGGLGNPGGDAKANAKLIAAAPDLLEAVKKFVLSEDWRKLMKNSKGEFDTALDAAKQAIKKATE